jgi:uncharacterized protein YdhG (YjbR/CyaY superfamily)
MTRFADHHAYIAAAPIALQPLLRQVRAVLAEALPGLDPVIRYDMPGFAAGSVVVAGFAAFSAQCGLYVAPGAIAAQTSAIAVAGLKATKTGVTFSPRKPIADGLVRALAEESRRSLGL